MTRAPRVAFVALLAAWALLFAYLATIEPIPIVTRVPWNISPPALPATVASAARRPSATPRLTTNSTLGPGIRIST